MKTTSRFLFAALLGFANLGQAQTGFTNSLCLGLQSQSTNLLLTVYAPSNFNDQVEIYRCTNLLVQAWTVATNELRPSSTNPATWITASESVGFFVAGNMNVDTDSDTLPDARETYVYRTDATDADTDEDAFNDGDEVQRLTDPLDPNSANRIIYVGTSGDNGYDGYAAAVSNGHGPKRNIANGLQTALDGDDVLILSEGSYIETNWTVKGSVNLWLNGSVTLP